MGNTNEFNTPRMRQLIEANRFMLDLNSGIPLAAYVAFLAVALWGDTGKDPEPLTIQDLTERSGLSYSAMSRHLRLLGDRVRTGQPGLGLVETVIYQPNRRRKTIRLTDKGRKLASRISQVSNPPT